MEKEKKPRQESEGENPETKGETKPEQSIVSNVPADELPPDLSEFMKKFGRREEGPIPTGKIVEIAPAKTRTFSIDLPSGGIPYQTDKYHHAYMDGKITLHPMTTAEEEILYSTGDFTNNLNRVLANCIADKQLDPLDLTAADRMAILLALRSFSLGTNYVVEIRCQFCARQFKTEIDLAEDLNIKKLEGIGGNQEEPFEFELPISKDKIIFRLMRGRDEVDVVRYANRIRQRTPDAPDPSESYRLAILIDSIIGADGNEIPMPDIMAKVKYVKSLILGDTNAFRLAIEKVGGFVDLTVFLTCSLCGAENEMGLPITPEFFRPTR